VGTCAPSGPILKPRIDTSRLPVILVTIDGAPTDEEHALYLDELAALAGRVRPHVCIVHALDAGALSAAQRKRQAEWLDRNREMLVASCAGNAFVFESALQRFMLSGIMLMTRMPFPHVVVGTLAEAEAWAAEQLARRRSSIPSPRRS
jgi:hypothetical protein